MKRIKAALPRLLRPGVAWRILLTILSAAALAFIFINELGASPFAYAMYAVSAYTLTILAIGIPGVARKIKALIYGNPYGNRYMTDLPFRAMISLHLSFAVNLIYAVFQLLAGIFYASVWYGAVAVYYIVLSVVRFLLLRHFRRENHDMKSEHKAYRLCGYLLFALNAAMTGMVVQMIANGKGARYPGFLIYAMAAYAFYRITISMINVVKYRKLSSPVLSASKAINLAAALMAIFSLQTAMLAEFGGGGDFQRVMNIATGGGVCLMILGMAVFMIVRANRALKEDPGDINLEGGIIRGE